MQANLLKTHQILRRHTPSRNVKCIFVWMQPPWNSLTQHLKHSITYHIENTTFLPVSFQLLYYINIKLIIYFFN